MENFHTFSNGIKVYDKHLIPSQRERYKRNNVHEPEEEDIFLKYIREIPEHGCFVNIGAAIGYYSLLAKRVSPTLKIHAFEPLQMHYDYFSENILLNGFQPHDFHVYREGVGAQSGQAMFLNKQYGSRIQGQHDNSHGQVPDSDDVSIIQVITLEQLVANVGGHVDLLQMDVQAFEAKILRAGTKVLKKQLIRRLLIGTHRQRIHQRCINILEKFSYKIEVDHYETVEQSDGILCAVVD